jgi:hypothetical protein
MLLIQWRQVVWNRWILAVAECRRQHPQSIKIGEPSQWPPPGFINRRLPKIAIERPPGMIIGGAVLP